MRWSILLLAISFKQADSFLQVCRRPSLRPLLTFAEVAVNEHEVELPTGVNMQFFSALPPPDVQSSHPLVFVHGSFHGGWCWAEHWMPWFAQRGYPCYSVSLRGTSGSPVKSKVVTIEEHVDDIAAFIEVKLPEDSRSTAVLVGHSFGGTSVMKFIENRTAGVDYGGAALLCSVPPSGNGPMTKRFIRNRPLGSLKIVAGFVAKLACVQPNLCRELFFGDTLNAAEEFGSDGDVSIQRFMARFKEDSEVGLDLKALASSLPSLSADEDGVARWLQNTKGDERIEEHYRYFVLGGKDDFLVDEEGVTETARFLGLDGAADGTGPRPPFTLLPGTPHDLMLGKRWRLGAGALAAWLSTRAP